MIEKNVCFTSDKSILQGGLSPPLCLSLECCFTASIGTFFLFVSNSSLLEKAHKFSNWQKEFLLLLLFFLFACCTLHCIELKCLWRSLHPSPFFASSVPEWFPNAYSKLQTVFSGFYSWAGTTTFRLKGWIKKGKKNKTEKPRWLAQAAWW